jgi:chaperonin GroES
MITPLYDRVVAKKAEPREVVINGIVLPPSAAPLPWFEGIVEGVGDGRLMYDGTVVPLKVKVGDRICWPQHSGHIFTSGSVSYVVLKEDEILGIQS